MLSKVPNLNDETAAKAHGGEEERDKVLHQAAAGVGLGVWNHTRQNMLQKW